MGGLVGRAGTSRWLDGAWELGEDQQGMEPIFLSNLNPASVDPRELVNRDADAKWLEMGLRAWMRSPDRSLGAAFCVLGEKGIGKSILTRQVIDRLREIHDATTVFLTVDCRPLRNQRGVYREAGSQLVTELARHDISAALLAGARSFDALSRFDTVSLRYAHEQLTQHKASFELGSSQSLAKWLDAKFGISMLRSKKTIEQLEGSITMDPTHVREGFVQLLRDITTHSDLRVILYLDNVEELAHEALLRDEDRERVRADVESLLHLAEAPLGLVLNMRTYYSSVLTRRINARHTLGPLAAAEHLQIFDRRLEREDPRDQATVRAQAAIPAALERLADLAETPLAFLNWTGFVLNRGLYAEADLIEALGQRLRSHYSSVARDIPRITALFETHDALVDAEVIRAACGGSDSLYRELIEQQILLPHNYWDPRKFSLDPELGFLLASAEA